MVRDGPELAGQSMAELGSIPEPSPFPVLCCADRVPSSGLTGAGLSVCWGRRVLPRWRLPSGPRFPHLWSGSKVLGPAPLARFLWGLHRLAHGQSGDGAVLAGLGTSVSHLASSQQLPDSPGPMAVAVMPGAAGEAGIWKQVQGSAGKRLLWTGTLSSPRGNTAGSA